jgi:ABC-type uncharacterized transport system ATPase subunit
LRSHDRCGPASLDATICSAIAEASADGAAVVVISADLDELMTIGHCMIV